MVRRTRSRSRRGGNEPPNAPAPNAPNAPLNANDLAGLPGPFNMQAFAGPKNITRDYATNHDFLNEWNGAPGEPNANSKQISREYATNNGFKDKWDAIPLNGARRRTRRRRHRTRKSRRGGYTEKSHKRHRVLKALTRHWRNKQQSHEVLSRANERGMEMLRRQAALRAKYNA